MIQDDFNSVEVIRIELATAIQKFTSKFTVTVIELENLFSYSMVIVKEMILKIILNH